MKCPVYLKLPWIGNVSLRFEKQIRSTIQRCYGALEPRIIYSTRPAFPSVHKDVLPTLQKSLVVYQYVCCCDSKYVGRTSQRLQDRINQHVPKFIRRPSEQSRVQPKRDCRTCAIPSCDSAIGQHLLENKTCAERYNDSQFTILSQARSNFHLSVLEAAYIKSKLPVLCRHKDFVYNLKF